MVAPAGRSAAGSARSVAWASPKTQGRETPEAATLPFPGGQRRASPEAPANRFFQLILSFIRAGPSTILTESRRTRIGGVGSLGARATRTKRLRLPDSVSRCV